MSTGLIVGAGGIGSEVARLTRDGVDNLVLFDRDAERLKTLAARFDCQTVTGDIASEDARQEIVRAVCNLQGALRWVVLTVGAGLRAPVADLGTSAVRALFAVNVVAPIALVAELLRRAHWGEGSRIVAVGSTSARRALRGRSVYGATKAALEAFFIALGVEVASQGILVNVVVAGATDTPFISGVKEDLVGWASERVPLGRLGRADEVAAAISFLLVTAPVYLNCTRVVVDGGAEAMP